MSISSSEATRPLGGYFDLQEAAKRAGYVGGASNLRRDAYNGRLRTVVVGRVHRLTTEEWLEEYLQTLRQGDYGRGVKRGGRGPRSHRRMMTNAGTPR